MKISVKKCCLVSGLAVAAVFSQQALAVATTTTTTTTPNACSGKDAASSKACVAQLNSSTQTLQGNAASTAHQVTVAGNTLQGSVGGKGTTTGTIVIADQCQPTINPKDPSTLTNCATPSNLSADYIDGNLLTGKGGLVHKMPGVAASATTTANASGGLVTSANNLLSVLQHEQSLSAGSSASPETQP